MSVPPAVAGGSVRVHLSYVASCQQTHPLPQVVLTSSKLIKLRTMKLRNLLVQSLILLLTTNLAFAQRRTTPVRNRAISNIVREIDARNIEATIRKLVSFATRSTLSEQNDPKRGIGAARDWLYSEFLKAAEPSNGRMTVEKQSFEQQKAARVPQPTIITNIVATLKLRNPTQ